jgi:hypothetical protein
MRCFGDSGLPFDFCTATTANSLRELRQTAILANAIGLLLCWHLLMSSRQLKPNRITIDEDNNKCSNEFRQPDNS